MSKKEHYEPQNKDEPMITPKALYEDNHSEQAGRLRQEREKARRKGDLTAYFSCGDARIFTPKPESSMSIRSIAAGGSKIPYERLVNNRGVARIVVLDHHDGDTVKPGQKPNGCGGLAAKEQVNGDKPGQKDGILEYIEHEVKHPDVIIQALLTAEEIARITDKPVMAATQDHLTEIIYPIAVFLEKGNHKLTAIRLGDIAGDQYNPTRLYADGIPVLPDYLIPPNFLELLEANRKEVAYLEKHYPNLRKKQKVQNPKMVVITTAIMSMRVRYPTISQEPGSLFKLNVPRKKEGTHTSISHADLTRTLNQAQYPIQHSVKNHDDPTKPFSATNTVLIETGDMDLSRKLAGEAVEKPWMKDWLSLPDHQIIVARTQAGITSEIEQFTK